MPPAPEAAAAQQSSIGRQCERLSALAVVTGTTHGIGRITSRELARAGYDVAMLCRHPAAATAVRAEIAAVAPGSAINVIACDLASFASVRACARELRSRFGEIALLINNAGIVSGLRRLSPNGFELTFATNHLGPFLLTSLLIDRMAAHGRIINVASRAHFRARFDLGHVATATGSYNAIAAYAQSKLANVLFTFALARRLAGTGVTANCLHPGVVASNLLPRWLRLVKPLISRPIFDLERGARTTLHLALSAEVAGVSGGYFDEYQQRVAAAAAADDRALQEALWLASERWTRAGAGPDRLPIAAALPGNMGSA
jgi:NAD(P)-dependent dehydrogenase (short-subunit alcohol dehydrogenase family)